MGIFDRLGRVARSEVSEMKRVLREARDDRGRTRTLSDDPWDDQVGYESDIAAADAELARDLGDPLSEVFARELGPAPSLHDTADDIARGASLWGSAPTNTPSTHPRDPALDGKTVAPGWVDLPSADAAIRQGGEADPAKGNPWARPASTPPEPAAVTPARPGRTETFPREVREAYAVLELPLGSDRSRIDQAFRALLQRYHPDHHAGQPELQRTANELTLKLRDARELLFAWLEGRH